MPHFTAQISVEASTQTVKPIWLGALAALLLIALVGCGNSVVNPTAATTAESLEVTDSATTLTFYLVISSDDQSALSLIDGSTLFDGAPGMTITQGDKHAGTKECTTTLSHEGHSYVLSYYVSGTVASNVIGGGTLRSQ